jgi:hypothetical protein
MSYIVKRLLSMAVDKYNIPHRAKKPRLEDKGTLSTGHTTKPAII